MPPPDQAGPDPTHGRIDRDIQAAVDEMNPRNLAQRVAIENTLQDRRHGWPLAPEPATPPAQPVHTAPAGDVGHPGTPDGPAVLGRALLDADGYPWPLPDRGPAEKLASPVREVLLVRPEVGRVLEAARELAAAARANVQLPIMGTLDRARRLQDAEHDLIAAVDALFASEPGRSSTVDAADGGTSTSAAEGSLTANQPTTGGPDHDGLTGQPAPSPLEAADCPRHTTWRDCAVASCPPPQEPAPEQAGDGPGWQRDTVIEAAEWLDQLAAPATGEGDQLLALLASYDDAAEEIAALRGLVAARTHERNSARAILKDAIDDTERLRTELAEEQRVSNQCTAAWNTERDRMEAEQAAHEGELGDMRAKLAAADIEVDELRELTATCACGDGNPETYEGPQPDCPVHGAVRAFNEASRELTEVRAQLETMAADRDGLAVQRDRLLGELDRLRADHLLIPKDRLIGYRVRHGYTDDTTTMYAPADVEIVVRDDPGQDAAS